MADRGVTCTEYTKRFADRERSLASLLPEHTALPDQHRQTVAAIWSLSIERADALTPTGLAAALLRVACLLAPNGIPAGVFWTSSVMDYLRSISGRCVPPEDARDALRCLVRLNLMSFADDGHHRTVRVHALVQRATAERFAAEDWVLLPGLAGDALLELWPDVERDAALRLSLCANSAVLHDATGTRLYRRGLHGVLLRAGRSLGVCGRPSAAHDYFVGLHAAVRDVLGTDHPDTLTALGECAYWQGKAGQFSESIATLTTVLAGQTTALGPHHPDVLATRGLLGAWQGHSGHAPGAAAQLAELLRVQLDALGADDVDTLQTRGNLAYWRGRTGNVGGAVEAFRELMEDRRRVLGADHPLTLTARNSLARSTGHIGNVASAAAQLEQVLVDRLRVLGPDHPDARTPGMTSPRCAATPAIRRQRLPRWSSC